MSKFNPHLINQVSELIQQQYSLNSEESYKYAIQVLKGIDSHGGDYDSWDEVKCVIDVVVKAWINDENQKTL